MSEIRFRFLGDDEYDKVQPIFESHGVKAPLPSLSKIAVAEEEDAISFYTFQLLPHAEPMFIHPKHRGSKVWLRLAAMIEPMSRLKPTFIVAESKESEAMCEALGLKRIDYPVYVTVPEPTDS